MTPAKERAISILEFLAPARNTRSWLPNASTCTERPRYGSFRIW